MTNVSGKCVGCVGFLVLVAAGGCDRTSRPQQPEVTIKGRTWRVELAMTEGLRYRGMSDRPSLEADKGMLFVYPVPQTLNFCMRKCLIPLDIAFIDANRRIVRIHTMAVEPYGEADRTYSSAGPAQYALEVAAGTFASEGITEGDFVEFSPSMPSATKAEPGP